MKRIVLVTVLAALSLAAVSCGPSAYTMKMDTRYPSASGIDFAGKSISVVFLDNGRDSLFSCTVADLLASKMEEDYFGGESGIGIYRLPEVSGSDYSSRDTLSSLIMELDTDVVILLDSPLYRGDSDAENPVVVCRAYAYDSMGADSVKVVQGRLLSSETDAEGAANLADALGEYYGGHWLTESFTLLYYGGGRKWSEALEYALDMKWDKAIDKWLELTDTKDITVRACAEYNIALGCLVSGQPQLALEWLDLSDRDGKVYLSSGLRTRINNRLEH